MDLLVVTVETFAPVVGHIFEAVFTDGRLPLTLAEARPLGSARAPGARAPFALTFQGRPKLRLPQGIYRLENTSLGTMEIFLVQVADAAGGSQFEAIFN
ncbi:conserved hypothetical protein [Chthoniobacter flavus Ellin428]|uniref:DUF6916 domain-containing protein n=1 Tax=Chthoniobacter flavus Ellin428 TaxID=497964 RepID=B4D823_9BACT|nr:hypothetical protein [Chthoniobacter flavus]EDY17377.1 conserved hypothetical protein [Chthoniobacter flavus Ellin428]TCO87373.1 hypothetical protein EV701_12252 [Chthoniobacter flavus]